jgi:Uma2 family endonuclease
MAAMTSVEAGRLTRADLAAMPDDGRRYELLDGAIIMTPAPSRAHQRAVTRLLRVLADAAPDDREVFVAPLDTVLSTGDVLEPDLLVTTTEHRDARDVTEIPLLVVEVLSPSSRRRDVGDKLTAYRDAGVPSYWVVDPVDPRLRAWRLEGGEYVEIADVSGDEEWVAELPYPVSVRPSDLLGKGTPPPS